MSEPVYDLGIIGGGINGAGIARDAAGRGASVVLFEQDDLASGTSSASTKLIHGGLRYLEHFEFRLVRESLQEREVIWGIAPHIVWPLRFVLPVNKTLRWGPLIRIGLWLYDSIGGRRKLPPTATLDLRRDAAGTPLKPEAATGFEYSDCWVEDARLVVLNARDAADRGASIRTRARVVGAERHPDGWAVTAETATGRETVRARVLVNAGGPWVGEVLTRTLGLPSRRRARLVQGSHIVTRRLYDHDRAYIFQNADRRIVFAIPYEGDFTLLGTTDRDHPGLPGSVAASQEEVAYLCASASEYFRVPVRPADVVWSYSGLRALYDDGASAAQEATRDYVLALDHEGGGAPLLSVFGGKITTYRRLAEAALARLAPHLPALAAPAWTAAAPLPGGDFPTDGFESLVAGLRSGRPWLPEPLARRLARAYGTVADAILAGVGSLADLGRVFGHDLTEREVMHLVRREWARTADDVLWRRSKLGLRLSSGEVRELDAFLDTLAREPA